jgi:hypothetical protein
MPGFAGFDRSDYPGDSIVDWLQNNTNLVWCGYYLAPAPSHPSTSWMTNRARLAGNGWGIAPLYVGQQVAGRGSLNPSAQSGVTDGNAAAGLMRREGFRAGSFVYLDIENGPPLIQAQQDYVGSWCDTINAHGYGAGVYCSHLLAHSIHNLRGGCRIWTFKVATTQPHPVANPFPDPNPSGSGYIRAYVWQLGQECMINVPPANLQILDVDLSSAIAADPCAP